jgi:hypothetical protein
MSAACKPARRPFTPVSLVSHAISAALVAATVYAAVCIERSEKIDPAATAVATSPSGMF